MALDRGVHLGGWQYDVEARTGGVYSTVPEGLWYRTETPRLTGPAFALPDMHMMRDPSLAATWAATGGAPVADGSGFRPLLAPWRTPRPGG